MVFLRFVLFEILLLKRFVFGVSGIVSKVLKMSVFPVLGAFLGWLIVVHLGLEGLGVFVFLVFVFFLWCFCFCFVCFVIGFVVGCCCFCFVCFSCFFCFLFFVLFLFFLFFLEGLRVR